MEDLIRRQDAIDRVSKAFDRETLFNSFVRKVTIDALKATPSAPVREVVRGKWIHINDGEDEPIDEREMRGWMPWYCSVCGVGVGKHQTTFCPNCGADMRGEKI